MKKTSQAPTHLKPRTSFRSKQSSSMPFMRTTKPRPRELLAQGVQINQPYDEGDTFLGGLVELLEVDAVRLLLKLGADPNVRDVLTGQRTLERLNRMYEDMGFAEVGTEDAFLTGIMKMLEGRAGTQMSEMKDRMDKIRAMLAPKE